MVPYKFWTGGVLWNGAPYNNVKTVQPTSYGHTHQMNPVTSRPIQLMRGGVPTDYELQFNSYVFNGDQVAFHYVLEIDNVKMAVTEVPRVLVGVDSVTLRRSFDVKNLPDDMEVTYAGRDISRGLVLEETYALTEVPEKPDPHISESGEQYWVERSGCATCHDPTEMTVGPSYEAIANRYEDTKENREMLAGRVKEGSTGTWGEAVMIPHPNLEKQDIEKIIKYMMSFRSVKVIDKVPSSPAKQAEETVVRSPGFGSPLVDVHPAFDLINIRPADFKPKVGAMAFEPDGSLLVATWDSIGPLYRLRNLESDDSALVVVDTIATGLCEPLGLTIVDNEIFIMQKQELTKLEDNDGDGVIDAYICVNNSFGVTPDFHEFSYGLVHHEGLFYGGLGLAMRLMSTERQLEDRGTVFSVSDTKDFKLIANGFRQPNGVGLGPDGEIFVTENQGQWVPSCKFIHVKQDHFYGCQFGTGDRFKDRIETPPAVWLPQHDIGNSPGQPILIKDGPYKGQMMHGEVSNGGIKRVFLEKRNGEYQGCVFRFSQGLEAGVQKVEYSPDGALYVGGVGMKGGWSHHDHEFGLQKLRYNGNVPFEMLSVSSRPHGFEIEFTTPLAEAVAFDQSKLAVRQFRYVATEAYGGPKVDVTDLTVADISISADRRKVQLEIDGLKEGYVIHFLLDESLVDKMGQKLWTGDAWYTLNAKQ